MRRQPAPTQEDVARVSGFSRTLVSRALRGSGRVSEEAKDRILQAATELGYRPNDMATGLASRSSSIVGLILPNARNPFFDAVCEALQRELTQAGQVLMVTFSGADPAVALAQAEHFLRMRVTGLLMVSPSIDDAELRELGRQGPLCLVGHLPVGGLVDVVRLDERAAADVVVSALAEAGVSSVAHVAPEALDPTGRERRDELQRAVTRRGLTWAGVADDDAGSAVRGLLGQATDQMGLVVHNDVLGLDAVAAVRAMGRETAAVIVSYDNTHLAARPEFDLSSVDQSTGTLAAEAVRLLLARSAGRDEAGRESVVAPRLITRSSLRR